eukprot:CAMPEP_0202700780 /NCGR_PEP_ID=MMETSP1385-20130828/13946_1 /ASSEMBLY_ACC=CAM_ASM_000861 /TAXON_ID=933848 /ORGANISM="Elphidium margaritaceum" /LENGTH=318 /DNA_ID=CAMNT_0049358045 /DNA_START=133 /DNA_END=1089 /DNA_ORIENTATION=+
MPDVFPPWAQFTILIVALFILGVMEGVQIGVVELAHKDPNKYRKQYPRAANLLALENKGRNVERFLLGRQVLVVMTVFVAARITTFEGFWDEMHALSYSGFLGVILVVVVAQLTPQVLAAAYPVEFLNMYGMKIAFRACLIVEATGLVHAVWFLCVVTKSMCGACLCRQSDEMDDYAFERVASRSPDNMDVVTVPITKDMSKVAGQAEEDIEVEVALKSKELDIRNRTEFMASRNTIDDEMATLIEHAGNNADFYYIYGDDNFMSPAQCFEKFKKAGLTPPNFLLPPEHKQHIPPHIVAMMLLKMYTEKNAQAPQSQV